MESHNKQMEAQTKQRELEEKRLQLQMQQQHETQLKHKELELQLEMQQSRQQHELQLAQLQQSATTSQPSNPSFRVDSAVKLLPKLLAENEIETYLIKFEKIATLNS